MWISNVMKLRWSAVVLGISNLAVIIFGIILIVRMYPNCGYGDILPFFAIWVVSFVRIVAMIRTAIAQRATALLVLNTVSETPIVDALIRYEKRMRYKRWLWWTRAAMIITVLQLMGATYLLFRVVKHISQSPTPDDCLIGLIPVGTKWQRNMLVLFMIMVCFVVVVQCLAGSDVLRWRSFYTTEDYAWKAHYHEVFDYGLREALCCMGRAKYLTVLEEDEVYSVAQLLGDLVAYRASGTGHLELLAGLALLQRHDQSPIIHQETVEAPEQRLHEAAAFHPFAEAAYTGLLLDFGRNPVLFPCAWLYRQGILTPWSRNRRPVLEGDNWWRGHAAAFLKYVDLSPEVLRRGRVNQAKCKAAYFVVVLHHVKSVVIAVRGTETPEDLITDGLCRECSLTTEDLDGLINIESGVTQTLESSLPHYGHSGIVEAARDLFIQIEGSTSDSGGFLSSLLGAGCECEGYDIRIVGHSLGGAISALLGLRLYRRYPRLHVYAYGPLPCMDFVIADACSEFVTSIIYHNEFSARLSVTSILRLRAAALMALSHDATTDSTTISKLARRFLFENNYLRDKPEDRFPATDLSSREMATDDTRETQHTSGRREVAQNLSHGIEVLAEDSSHDETEFGGSPDSFINPFYDTSTDVNACEDPVSRFMEAVPSAEKSPPEELPDMFLPGLVIHIVPERNNFHLPLWKRWRIQENECSYKAYIANRESFKDIIVSPSMFLDHLPWRCHYAMRKVLQTRSSQVLLDGSQLFQPFRWRW